MSRLSGGSDALVDARLARPAQNCVAGELRPIVADDHCRPAALGAQAGSLHALRQMI